MNNCRIVLMLLSVLMGTGLAKGEIPGGNSKADNGAKQSVRPLFAIRADVLFALGAEASSRRDGDNTPEVLRLIDLYREMAYHPQRDNSVALKELGQQVRSRLEKVRDHIERKISDRAAGARNNSPPAHVIPETHVLAQQVPPPAGAAGGQGGQRNRPGGTPQAAFQPIDYGPELVELIQQIISPTTWDVNGGKSSIVYFSPLRVLVVSAPGEVHDQIGDLLGQLRAAQ